MHRIISAAHQAQAIERGPFRLGDLGRVESITVRQAAVPGVFSVDYDFVGDLDTLEFKGKAHPAAGGGKPAEGDREYVMHIPLELGRNLVVRMGAADLVAVSLAVEKLGR